MALAAKARSSCSGAIVSIVASARRPAQWKIAPRGCCSGMEASSFFSELLPRLDSVELAAEPQHVATTFVGGLKHLPVRYSLR